MVRSPRSLKEVPFDSPDPKDSTPYARNHQKAGLVGMGGVIFPTTNHMQVMSISLSPEGLSALLMSMIGLELKVLSFKDLIKKAFPCCVLCWLQDKKRGIIMWLVQGVEAGGAVGTGAGLGVGIGAGVGIEKEAEAETKKCEIGRAVLIDHTALSLKE